METNQVKLYYTEAGYLCNRYPTDYPVTDENRYLEVDAETAAQTTCVDEFRHWAVVDGALRIVDAPMTEEDRLLKAKREKSARIAELRERLLSLSEDFAQVSAGEYLPDLAEKKAEFIATHNELRMLLGKAPRARIDNTATVSPFFGSDPARTRTD